MSRSKKTTPRRFLCVLLLIPSLSLGATTCQTIQDADQRAYCKAIQSRSRNQCSEIRAYELRQTCRVKLGDTPAICNTVRDAWERSKCRDGSK